MKKVHFFSSLFAVLLLTANANAIDFGKMANKAKEEAENAVIGTAKKYKENDTEAVTEEYVEDKKTQKRAKPVSNPAVAPTAPAVQLNSTVNLAVLETQVDAEPTVAKEFKASELHYITQEIHRQSVNNLPKPKFCNAV
jgi:Zn-dependent M16 (insulinase) family peptidase